MLCLFPPLGVRNYLKEALVNIITVHAEVQTPAHTPYTPSPLLALWNCPSIMHHAFTRLLSNASVAVFYLYQVFTVSKDLVPRVLSKIVESVAEEMCRLMQCVSSFSKNGSLQVVTDTHSHVGRAVHHS